VVVEGDVVKRWWIKWGKRDRLVLGLASICWRLYPCPIPMSSVLVF
jgi:hypothetical protein